LTPADICKHWLSFLPNQPFLSETAAGRIDDFYHDDWSFVCNYASRRREEAGRPIAGFENSGIETARSR
jgi:hypothetical protein